MHAIYLSQSSFKQIHSRGRWKGMDLHEVGFYVWYGFRVLFLILMGIYILTGLDDLIIDVVYYARSLYRRTFVRRLIQPVTQEQLDAVPEKRVALIVPAWDESNVIARMLLNTASSIRYRNFNIFVGTYPNDEATRLEVEKIREVYGNVEAIVTPREGPTNKADCLNWVYQGILLHEKTYNVHFDIFVFHDSEDIVHPLSFKFYNYLIPRVEFIQIPVFPLEREWKLFTYGCYMDEFAEMHTKDMRAREIMAACLPSAGVGTALSRRAIDYMASLRRNQIFDIKSLTEDYMMGLLLKDLPGKKIFLQQTVERVVKRRNPWTGRERDVRVREWIATREFFPDTFATATRQKARWILGISMQGWKAGWSRSLGLNYFLLRDRKAVATNLMVILAYVVVAYWTLTALMGAVNPAWIVPPLLSRDDRVFRLMYVVLAFMVWRFLNRVYAVNKIYGWQQSLLSIPRLFWGNIVNFWSTWKAIERYVKARVSGREPEWGKTSHAFPTEEQLRTFHRKLGDLLLERRLVTTAQLDAAVAHQKESGRRLGEILLEMGVLWEEDLIQALAHQQNEQSVELDPSAIPPEVLAVVPQALAERYRVVPVEVRGETLVLATDVQEREPLGRELRRVLQRPVLLRWTSSADIQFALSRVYQIPSPAAGGRVQVGERLGERFVRDATISQADLVRALRQQKRTNQKLGEILVEMNIVSPDALAEELNRL